MSVDASAGSAASDAARTEPGALVQLARGSDAVFVGKVSALGPAPPYWSGRFTAYQEVTYSVTETLKGEVARAVKVRHVVVKGSPTAEPGDRPALADQLFAPGSVLVVCARKDGDGWVCLDERVGAVVHSAELVEKLKAALKH